MTATIQFTASAAGSAVFNHTTGEPDRRPAAASVATDLATSVQLRKVGCADGYSSIPVWLASLQSYLVGANIRFTARFTLSHMSEICLKAQGAEIGGQGKRRVAATPARYEWYSLARRRHSLFIGPWLSTRFVS